MKTGVCRAAGISFLLVLWSFCLQCSTQLESDNDINIKGDTENNTDNELSSDLQNDSALNTETDTETDTVFDSDTYIDPNEEFSSRAEKLVSQMTLEEKVSQMGHISAGIPRLNIRSYNWWNEALHGVARSGIATVFPQAISLASTFDADLMLSIATVISTEARVKANTENKGLTYWSPTVNLARDPRWGRNEETYGEDPYLASRMSAAFVKGMQGDHPKYLKTVSTLKHFAANNVEATRHTGSSDVDERNLRELYFPAFKAGVEQGAHSIMCAYNAVNGIPSCANTWLLDDVLRKEWGFDGYVVSDCWAIEDIYSGHHYMPTGPEASKAALAAGTDLNCGHRYQADLVWAVENGLVEESDIDRALTRLFTARFKLGEFDDPKDVPYIAIPASELDSEANKALALEAARKSMILLKNDGILPVNRETVSSIAVIGPNAARIVFGGYSGQASAPVTPLSGIQTAVEGYDIDVSYAEGSGLSEASSVSDFLEAEDLAASSDIAIVVVGLDLLLSNEEVDRADIVLPPIQEELVKTVREANPNTVLVLVTGNPLAINWAHENVSAIINAGYGGQSAGQAIAEVIFGDYNPAGRLPQTYYRSVNDLPPIQDYDIIGKKRTYMYFEGEPLYSFGHGLSYTEFDYTNLKVTQKDDELSVSAEIQNIGKREGEEVVQLYVRDVEASVPTAKRQLKRFARILLKANEKKTVNFTIPTSELSFFDVKTKKFVVEPGVFEIELGASSSDIRLTTSITVD